MPAQGTQFDCLSAPAECAANGSATRRLQSALFAPVDNAFLACFRIAFGAIMLWHVARYFTSGEIQSYYIDPKFHFTYLGFDWVRPWPGQGMYVHFALMGIFALGILLGCCYRLCALAFCLAFTYQFLLDKTYYQNHYYLVALISLLMVVLPAHRTASIDAWLRPALRSDFAPAWTLWLLRFQIGVPYFFGGIAKINPDWLRGEPMRMGMAEPHRTGIPLIGQFFTQEWMVVLFNYGGLVFDLAIVPLLLWRRTRPWAFGLCVSFHLLNDTMFNIGIFPWFMLLATLAFFEPDWPKTLARCAINLLAQLRGKGSEVFFEASEKMAPGRNPVLADFENTRPLDRPRTMRLTLCLLAAWMALQMLVPLRHFVYPGDPSWNEEGHMFAWHMMLRGKRSVVDFVARNPVYPEEQQFAQLNPRRYLTDRQISKLGKDPDLILQLSRFMADEMCKAGHTQVEVYVVALVSLNGRKPQLLVDPNTNLAAEERTWRPYPWVMPLTEPLRREPWNVPEQHWVNGILLGQK